MLQLMNGISQIGRDYQDEVVCTIDEVSGVQAGRRAVGKAQIR